MPSPPIDRWHFPVLDTWVPLNHAGVTPLGRPVVEAMNRYLDDAMANASATIDDWFTTLETVRDRAAALLGAEADELAFVKNTTEGLSFVAQGLTWSRGDKIVVPDIEFPSNLSPWLNLIGRGVEVVRMRPTGAADELPLEAFEAALKLGRVKLVAVSWVQWERGWRIDLRALADLCHAYGALLCADVIQGAGAIPLDLHATDVDFASCGGQKWLLGPVGTGLFYVAEGRLGKLRPVEAGWNSNLNREGRAIGWQPTVRRFEGGVHNVAGVMGLGAGMHLVARPGVAAVWDHIRGLTDRAAAALAYRVGAVVSVAGSEANRSGIVSFTVPGRDAVTLEKGLREAGFLVAERSGRLRISPHAYNDERDIDLFVDALAEMKRRL